MHRIKGLIFDLGNTLMCMHGEWEKVIRGGAEDLAQFLVGQGFKLDPAVVVDDFISLRKSLSAKAREELVEYSAEYALATLLARWGHRDVSSQVIEEATLALFSDEESRWHPYPEAEATLRQLSEMGYRLALFSNATDDPLIQRLVDKGGFRRWLDPALSSAGVGIRKPDPKVFEGVLDQWRLSPTQVLMIGDMLEFDIAGAHNVGMKGILAAWDLYPNYAEGCDHIVPEARVESMSELVEAVIALDGQIAKGGR